METAAPVANTLLQGGQDGGGDAEPVRAALEWWFSCCGAFFSSSAAPSFACSLSGEDAWVRMVCCSHKTVKDLDRYSLGHLVFLSKGRLAHPCPSP